MHYYGVSGYSSHNRPLVRGATSPPVHPLGLGPPARNMGGATGGCGGHCPPTFWTRGVQGGTMKMIFLAINLCLTIN